MGPASRLGSRVGRLKEMVPSQQKERADSDLTSSLEVRYLRFVNPDDEGARDGGYRRGREA